MSQPAERYFEHRKNKYKSELRKDLRNSTIWAILSTLFIIAGPLLVQYWAGFIALDIIGIIGIAFVFYHNTYISECAILEMLSSNSLGHIAELQESSDIDYNQVDTFLGNDVK